MLLLPVGQNKIWPVGRMSGADPWSIHGRYGWYPQYVVQNLDGSTSLILGTACIYSMYIPMVWTVQSQIITPLQALLFCPYAAAAAILFDCSCQSISNTMCGIQIIFLRSHGFLLGGALSNNCCSSISLASSKF